MPWVLIFTSHISGRGNRIGPVCLSLRVSVCLLALSQLNHLVRFPSDPIPALYNLGKMTLKISQRGSTGVFFTTVLSRVPAGFR